MSFLKKIFKNGMSMGLQFGSRWALNLMLALYLTNANYGVFALIYMIANLATPAMSFGANFYIIHNLSKDKTQAILLSSLSLTFIAAFIIIIVSILFQYANLISELPYYHILIGLSIGLNWSFSQVCFAYLKGNSNFDSEVKIQFCAALFLIALTSILYFTRVDEITSIILCLYIISFIPLLGCLYSTRKSLLLEKSLYLKKEIKLVSYKDIKQRSIYAVHDLISMFFANLPFIFMAIYASIDQFGMFRKISVLVVPLTLIPVIISQVLLNRLSQIRDHKDKVKSFVKIAIPFSTVGTTFWLIVMLYSTEIMSTILPEHANETNIQVLNILLFTTLIVYLKTFIEVLLTSFGAHHLRTQALFSSTIFASIIYLYYSSTLTSMNAAVIYLSFHSLLFLFLILVLPLAYKKTSH